MAQQAEIQEALQALSISAAPPEWTNEVWEQNFCEGVSFPPQLEKKSLLNERNWARLVRSTRRWLEESEGQGEKEDGELRGVWCDGEPLDNITPKIIQFWLAN